MSGLEDVDVSPAVMQAADRLADGSTLTRRQALAWILRKSERVRREEAAERMGISTSTLDKHLGRAREQIAVARRTVELVDELEGDSA